ALVASVATGDNPRLAEAGSRLALITTMFSFALDQGIIDAHPSLRLKVPGGKPKPRTRALTTAKELRTLWRVTEPGSIWTRHPLQRAGGPKVRNDRFSYGEADALRLLLLTGARASEVAELPWSELDLDAGTWLLPAERSKNAQPNLVPLLRQTVAIL